MSPTDEKGAAVTSDSRAMRESSGVTIPYLKYVIVGPPATTGLKREGSSSLCAGSMSIRATTSMRLS